jgi:hypothetical protein
MHIFYRTLYSDHQLQSYLLTIRESRSRHFLQPNQPWPVGVGANQKVLKVLRTAKQEENCVNSFSGWTQLLEKTDR